MNHFNISQRLQSGLHGFMDSKSGSKTPSTCGSRKSDLDLGNPPSLESFDDVIERLEQVEKLQISGRYHRRPRQIDADYNVSSTVLGSGINGDVKLCTSRHFPNQRFAVKAFNFADIPRKKRQQLESEVEVFLQMDHPHIARLMDVYESDEHLDLVMECMEGGELFDRLKQKKRFPECEVAEATYQMLLAMNYIHQHDIMHGDIKLENFMYDGQDHLKLIDFGFSVRVSDTSVSKASGTLSYIAPEVLDMQGTQQSDQWSLGVIVFVMLCGYMPFSGAEMEQMKKISEGTYKMSKERWKSISPDAIDFVRRLLRVNPKLRLTAEDALEHPFIVKMHTSQPAIIELSVIEALCDWRHATVFRRLCYEMMAWVLSNEERAQVEEYFLAMDEHHHGAITFNDLKSIMGDKFRVPEQEVKRVFVALDAHQDGEIHYSDFLAAMIFCGHVQVCEEHVRETFRKFDSRDAGYITTDNLREVWGDKIDGQSVERLFCEVDVNKSGRVTYDEFASYMSDKPLQPTPPIHAKFRRDLLRGPFRCGVRCAKGVSGQRCCTVQ